MDKFLKKIELLAPAGRWNVLDAVLKNGADAVYIAGKEYNMRRHRSDFNFSRDEIARATEKVHAADTKIYITANSLLSDRELDEIGGYLEFLESIAVDAMIVQDPGLIQRVNQMGIDLPLHASTMMNIHSAEGARACAKSGISRIICSRDVALNQVKQMREGSGLEMEYFVHGDMCIAESGQCYMSGVLFGKSGNRGKCMKPCRWSYHMVNTKMGDFIETKTEGSYLLATKDLCLLEFIPELVEAGVTSLKIEGRMRAPDFLATVIKVYRKALDEYCSDPFGYVNNIDAYEELYRDRVRDFSTCCALKKPDGRVIGSSGKREPLFLSTGCKEKEIDLLNPKEDSCFEGKGYEENAQRKQPLLAVHAGSPESAHEALKRGADWIYIGGEVSPSRGQRWDLSSLRDTICRAHDKEKKVGLLTPRVTPARQLEELKWFLDQADSVMPDAVLVHNLGSLQLVREHSAIPLQADFSLNVLNHRSIEFLHQLGVRQVTLSLEASFETLKDLAGSGCIPLECIVHGPIPGMFLEHCLISMSLMGTSSQDPCRGPCRYLQYGLSDEQRQIYPIEVDQYCRTHLLLSKDLACLNYIPQFARTGVRTLRIEGQYYEKELVGVLTELYADLIKNESNKIDSARLKRLIALSPRRFSLGAYPKGICEDSSKTHKVTHLPSKDDMKESQLAQSAPY
jgi:putative protease